MALASAAAELLGAAGRFHDLLESEGGAAAPGAAAFVGDRFEVHVRTLQGQLLVTVNQTLATAADPSPQGEPAAVGFFSDADLLTEPQVLVILVASLFVCAVLHFVVPVPTKVKLAGPRLTYWRRVVRAQLYYLVAGIAGPVMLWEYQSKEELLYRFTRRHQVAFAVAIAHWVVATVEDFNTQGLLAQGIERVRVIGDQGKDLIFRGYILHHVATIGIFVFCLWSHYLSSICVLGFCFEIPVFFMNIREFLYTFRDTWRAGKLDKGYVNNLWTIIFVLFVLSRGGSHALYFHSVVYWKPMLATLPTKVWYLYHAVSLFFLLLNYSILNVLSIWYRMDLEADSPSSDKAQPARAAARGEAAGGSGRAAPSGVSHCPMGPASAPAVQDMENPVPAGAGHCPLGHGAAADDSPVAGGDEPRKNSTASKIQADREAKKARFAAAAKEDEVCRKWKLGRGYRMGSFYGGAQGETVQLILDNLSYVSAMSLLAYWASTLSWGLGGDTWDAEMRSLFALVVLLCAGGLGTATATRLKRLPKVLSRCLSPAVHFGSLCLVALLVCCACCWQSPGISLLPGVAIALVITELVQCPLTFGPDHLVLLGISFWVFDAEWPSIVFGLSLAGCVHTIARLKGDSGIVSKVAIVLMAAVYSAVGIVLYWRSTARFGSLTVGLLQLVSVPQRFHCLIALPVALHMFLTWFDAVVSLSWLLNAAMVTRTVCYVTMLWHLGDSWVMVGWLVHMRRLMLETRRELKEPGAAPNVMIAVEQIDVIRSAALSFLWRVIAQLLSVIFNMWLLPSDVMVYVFPAPFPRIVTGMSCGVCVSVDGPRDMKPEAFVCNVGHIDTDCDDWQDDLQRTARSSIGILREFEKHPDKEELGLVTNILCFLPVDRSAKEPGAQEFFKEFNFSAWKSEKHAYDWYVRSPDHKEVMTEHTNGILKRFGNVLTSLKPTREIRWQGRCSDPKCASLVEGYPEVRECECGAPVIDMPLF